MVEEVEGGTRFKRYVENHMCTLLYSALQWYQRRGEEDDEVEVQTRECGCMNVVAEARSGRQSRRRKLVGW